MPSFKAILPFWRHHGPKPGTVTPTTRTRPLPKSILLGTRHELIFDVVMEAHDSRRKPPRPRRPVLA